MIARSVWVIAFILMGTQAFALTANEKSHGCNHEVGDCPDQNGGGGGGGESNTNIVNIYDGYWIAADGKSAGYDDWTTVAKKGSNTAGSAFKIIPGKKPDFANLPMAKGLTPQAFKDYLAAKKAAEDKAAAEAAAKAAAAKAATEAANKAGGVYTGPAIVSQPAGGGTVARGRTKP